MGAGAGGRSRRGRAATAGGRQPCTHGLSGGRVERRMHRVHRVSEEGGVGAESVWFWGEGRWEWLRRRVDWLAQRAMLCYAVIAVAQNHILRRCLARARALPTCCSRGRARRRHCCEAHTPRCPSYLAVCLFAMCQDWGAARATARAPQRPSVCGRQPVPSGAGASKRSSSPPHDDHAATIDHSSCSRLAFTPLLRRWRCCDSRVQLLRRQLPGRTQGDALPMGPRRRAELTTWHRRPPIQTWLWRGLTALAGSLTCWASSQLLLDRGERCFGLLHTCCTQGPSPPASALSWVHHFTLATGTWVLWPVLQRGQRPNGTRASQATYEASARRRGPDRRQRRPQTPASKPRSVPSALRPVQLSSAAMAAPNVVAGGPQPWFTGTFSCFDDCSICCMGCM